MFDDNDLGIRAVWAHRSLRSVLERIDEMPADAFKSLERRSWETTPERVKENILAALGEAEQVLSGVLNLVEAEWAKNKTRVVRRVGGEVLYALDK